MESKSAERTRTPTGTVTPTRTTGLGDEGPFELADMEGAEGATVSRDEELALRVTEAMEARKEVCVDIDIEMDASVEVDVGIKVDIGIGVDVVVEQDVGIEVDDVAATLLVCEVVVDPGNVKRLK